jgi:hypothetical protein
VLFPEVLFVDADGEDIAIAYTGGAWTINAVAATAAQLALIDLSMWFWRGFFHRSTPRYRNEDGGKVDFPVTFEMMHDLTKPNGHQIMTLGDPDDAGINIDPAP